MSSSSATTPVCPFGQNSANNPEPFLTTEEKVPLSILEQSNQSLSAFGKKTFPLGGGIFLV
jgi:hypothetical protein